MRAYAIAIVVLLPGCFGADGGRPGPEELPTPLVFPSDYAIDGAEELARNSTSVRFRWSGTASAALHAPSGDGIEATPSAELQVPVPTGLPLLFDVQLSHDPSGTSGYSFLRLQVIDAAERLRCNRLDDNVDATAHCRVGAGPLAQEEAWLVRVVSERNADPNLPFVVELTWTVFAPTPVPPLPEGQEFQPEPHAIVAIADSGINPYHEVFYRPERTQHPCTYIQDFPCSVQTLNLSIGLYHDFKTAVAADHAIWTTVERDTWYWIPRTAIIAASCPTPAAREAVVSNAVAMVYPPDQPECLLEAYAHGTGTASAALLENPEALLVITQAPERGGPAALASSGIPFDLHSYSYGSAVPGISDDERTLQSCQDYTPASGDRSRLFFLVAGNWAHNQPPLGPPSTLTDCMAGNPYVISVGAAYASDQTQDPLAAWHPEVVSWFRRPVARHDSITEYEDTLGTSFGVPTVVGALSKVILDLRRSSGYLGSIQDGFIDPVLGITNGDLRTALNLTASYSPQAQYNNTGNGIPLNPLAPWQQWGWGFYDSTVTDATVAHLLGTAPATKPIGAVQWMEAQHAVKKQLWGS